MKITFEEFSRFATHEREPFFRMGIKYYTGEGNVLDVGAGIGEFADMLGYSEIHLIEGNPETSELLRRKYLNVHQLNLPCELPFSTGYFSLIHTSHLVEHLHPHELHDLLTELNRCLAPGGYLVISTPLMWEGFYDDLSHIRPYPPSVFQRYLCDARSCADSQRTRPVVANEYEVVETVYRYRARTSPFMTVSYTKHWAQKLLFLFSQWLQSVQFSAYERTGYTLVLRKNSIVADPPSTTIQ